MIKKDLINKKKASVHALDEINKKISELIGRHKSSADRLEDLRSAIRLIEKSKTDTLDRFVSGEAAQDDVDLARDAYDRAKKNLSNEEELMETISRALEIAEKSVPALRTDIAQVDREFWMAIFDDVKTDITKAIGEKVINAFYARRSSGLNTHWDEFLFKDIFGSWPSPEQLNKAGAQLESEYLK